MSIIKINQLTSQKQLTKRSVGTNIFLKMKAIINQNQQIDGFILDFENIKACSPIVFQVMIQLMKVNFNGHYKLELINHNNLIGNALKLVIGTR